MNEFEVRAARKVVQSLARELLVMQLGSAEDAKNLLDGGGLTEAQQLLVAEEIDRQAERNESTGYLPF